MNGSVMPAIWQTANGTILCRCRLSQVVWRKCEGFGPWRWYLRMYRTRMEDFAQALARRASPCLDESILPSFQRLWDNRCFCGSSVHDRCFALHDRKILVLVRLFIPAWILSRNERVRWSKIREKATIILSMAKMKYMSMMWILENLYRWNIRCSSILRTDLNK